MPPKKPHAKAIGSRDTVQAGRSEEKVEAHDERLNGAKANSKAKHKEAAAPPSSASKKRKQPDDAHAESTRSRRKSARGAAKPEPKKLLKFLLSNEAIDLSRPQDEIKDLKGRDSKIKTYSTSELSPFEELISAVILSRPISHALGVRSIRTIFNDPYNFNSPKAIQDAGPEKRLQALYDARTQHKDKTAEQLGQVADTVVAKFSNGNAEDTSLEGVRKAGQEDIDEESDLLTKSIKGIGKTGMSIFFRRIQWLWPECYPYIDERTEKALVELGLPQEPEELKKLIEENWDSVAPKGIAEGKDTGVRKRRAFVIVLERATGVELENNISQLLEASGSA